VDAHDHVVGGSRQAGSGRVKVRRHGHDPTFDAHAVAHQVGEELPDWLDGEAAEAVEDRRRVDGAAPIFPKAPSW
jgi:hypothetical protein